MKTTPKSAVKHYCLWCCLNQWEEVKQCGTEGCPLYPVRGGHNRTNKRAKWSKLARKKCLDCSVWIKPDVKYCKFDGKINDKCQLYDYRMGKNPVQSAAMKKVASSQPHSFACSTKTPAQEIGLEV